jgi:hypothetical protein
VCLGVESGAAEGLLAIEEAVRAPYSMEGVIHLINGVLETAIVGTSATDEIVTIFRVRASAIVDGHSHSFKHLDM